MYRFARKAKGLVSEAVALARNVANAARYRRDIGRTLARLLEASAGPEASALDVHLNAATEWHRAYAIANGVSSPHYVSDDLFFNNIEPYYCRFERTRFLEDKNNYDKLGIGWPTPETVLRLIEGRFYDRAFRPTEPMTALAGLPAAVVKPARDTGDGRAVRLVVRDRFESEIARCASVRGHEDLVIQTPIRQSAFMARFNPSSVNTLRIATTSFDGEAEALAAVLRMGRPGSVVDNSMMGGLHVGVRSDGRLIRHGFDIGFQRYAGVPGTDIVFDGLEVPGWPAARDCVVRLQQMFPEIGIMSWDVALDEADRPIVIEVNLRYQSIYLLQLAHGPLFGDRLPDILARTRPRSAFGVVIG